ncbi:hypothetical protein [Aeromonas sp. sia0103]|uniref:hypothetical protein n=1 Tax=Aeromonas sp. sia0103 TaxID=2854782 RepID=UPI001C461CB2|nr:hypothetical protein [Aeromonas sp. sia0103]MBV7599402.1 hypothetical protein [Aeromonas sp. sia0103]
MRDPRKQPVPGDVITRFGTTREVTATRRNERGTVTHVLYEHPGQTHLEPAKEATISSWRAWAKEDAMVIKESAA